MDPLPEWIAIDRDSGQAVPLPAPSRSPSFVNYRRGEAGVYVWEG